MHNIEIEQYLLASLINNPDAFYEIQLTSNDFFAVGHQLIFGKIQSMISEKGAFDYLQLSQWAKGQDFNKENDYIQTLRDSCITSATSQIKEYSKIIKNLSKKRKIQNQIMIALEQLKDPEIEPDFILDRISAIYENQDQEPLKTGQEVLNLILEGLKTPNKCHPTGLKQLDRAMGGGLYEGWTYGFGGAEKAGKTMLAGTIANNMTKNGTKLLYIALEMGSVQIEQRQIAARLGFNPMKFLQDKPFVATKVSQSQANDNIFYMDMAGATLEEILLCVVKAKAKFGIDGFIVDYWQLIENNTKFPTEEQKLRHNAQALANFARKKGIFCVLMAQVNKTGDLFGGNGLVKACDQLYLIRTPEDELRSDERWLEMRATRYTQRADLGSEQNSYLKINKYAVFEEQF
jgi:replicative DNA helicase